MAFLCPVRIRKTKKKQGSRPLERPLDAPIPGRITGSDSIDTLVRVGLEKEAGPRARMIVVHDFVPCVEDELEVKRGQYVHVLYQENDWLYVISDTGREGFIPYTYCVPIERSVDDFVNPKNAPKQQNNSHNVSSVAATTNRQPNTLQQSNNHNVSSVAATNNRQSNQPQEQRNQQIRQPPIGGASHPALASAQQDSNLSRASSKSLPDIAAACENTAPNKQNNKGASHKNPPSYNTFQRSDYRSQRSSSSHSTDRKPLQNSAVQNSGPNKSTAAQVNSPSNGDTSHEYYNVRPFHRHSYHYGIQTQDIAQRNNRQNDNQYNRTNSETSQNYSEQSHFRNNRSGSSRSLASSASVTSSKSLPNTMDRSRDSRRSYSSDRNSNGSRDYNYQRSSTLPNQANDPRYNQGQSQSRGRSAERPATQVFVKRPNGRYIVLFPYSPTQENDLTVSRGEFVTVLNKDDPDWFFVRRSDNQEGFVPGVYLCQAEGQHLERSSRSRQSSQSSSHYHQQDVSTSVDPSFNFSPSRSTKLVCLYDYRAQAPGDLTVSRGQWLYSDLDSQVDSEWLWVYSPATRKSGYIPRTYAKPPNFGLIGAGNTETGDLYFSP